jgi:hypothetical protein
MYWIFPHENANASIIKHRWKDEEEGQCFLCRMKKGRKKKETKCKCQHLSRFTGGRKSPLP